MAVKKLPNGKYVADFRDANGQRYRPQFDTRKEADAALNEARSRIRKGEFIAQAQIPNFGEVARAWLAARASSRAAVMDNYRRHVECYWLPRLENTRLDRIDVQMIEGFRDELGKRLAVSTQRSVMNTLGQVFKFAVRHGKLVTNPMYSVERLHTGAVELVAGADPGEQSEGNQAVRPGDVLNLDEIRRLIVNARPGLYRTLFAVAAATGARSGELFGLTWGAVDQRRRSRRPDLYSSVIELGQGRRG
jgi:integrase